MNHELLADKNPKRPIAGAPGKGFLATLLTVITCQIGLHACMMGMRVAVPLQVLESGHSAWAVGVLLALFAIFPALLALPAGRVIDRRGYHTPIRVSAGLSLIGALSAAVSGHLAALAAAAALCGAGSAIGMIAMQRTASGLATDAAGRMRLFSWIALAPAAAVMVGPTLAGTMIDYAGFRWAFAALAVLPGITLMVSMAAARGPTPGRDSATPDAPPVQSSWDLLRRAPLRRLLLVNWLIVLAWDVHTFALPILGFERGLSPSAIGGIMAAYSIGSVSVRLLIPFIAHRLSQRLMLTTGLLLLAGIFAAYPLLHNVLAMAACAASLGLVLGTVQPSLLSSLHDAAPTTRYGETLALRSMCSHVSMATAPLLLGAVGVAIGASALFWLMAGVLTVGTLQTRATGNSDYRPA